MSPEVPSNNTHSVILSSNYKEGVQLTAVTPVDVYEHTLLSQAIQPFFHLLFE